MGRGCICIDLNIEEKTVGNVLPKTYNTHYTKPVERTLSLILCDCFCACVLELNKAHPQMAAMRNFRRKIILENCASFIYFLSVSSGQKQEKGQLDGLSVVNKRSLCRRIAN